MAKTNRQGSQKGESNTPQANEERQSQSIDQSMRKKSKQSSGKKYQATVGGTAVPGAKSTQPKELSTNTPPNQQGEFYNRETRRRMQQMGTGPYSESAALDPRERRRKRLERIKERQERMKQLVDSRGPSRDIKLGRKNTYFLIGIVGLVILLIVVFLIIRHPF